MHVDFLAGFCGKLVGLFSVSIAIGFPVVVHQPPGSATRSICLSVFLSAYVPVCLYFPRSVSASLREVHSQGGVSALAPTVLLPAFRFSI